MDPKIWSNLPLFVVAIVIESTTDKPTLESWVRATAQNRFLHRSAVAMNYSAYSCNLNHLIDDSNTNVKRLDPSKSCGFLPALKIKHLHLDFANPPELVEFYADKSLVQNLDNNLRRLFPLLSQLLSLDVDGFATQRLLDNLYLIPSPTFHSLVYKARFNEDFPFENETYDIHWQNLAQFQSLRTLKILDLSSDNTKSLLRAITSLSQLEHLSLRAHYDKSHSFFNRSTFYLLIQGLFPWTLSSIPNHGIPSPTECLLPSSLKTLSLEESYAANDYASDDHDVAPPPVDKLIHRYSALTDLKIDWLDVESVINVIEWLGQPPLSRVSIRGGNGLRHPQYLSSVLEYTSLVNYLLQIYEVNKEFLLYIQSIWDAYTLLSSSINETWAGKAAVTDLVLGNSCGCFRRVADTLEAYLLGCQDCYTKTRWGGRIERLRLERVDLRPNKFSIEHSTNLDLPHLKVIQIRPLATPWEVHIHQLTKDQLLSCPDTRYAADILAAFPSLRIITIQTHTFWVQHAEDEIDKSLIPEWRRNSRLWGFTEASAIPEFKAIMSAVLKPEDINFLNLGACERDDDPEDIYCIKRAPKDRYDNNYMIVRFL